MHGGRIMSATLTGLQQADSDHGSMPGGLRNSPYREAEVSRSDNPASNDRVPSQRLCFLRDLLCFLGGAQISGTSIGVRMRGAVATRFFGLAEPLMAIQPLKLAAIGIAPSRPRMNPPAALAAKPAHASPTRCFLFKAQRSKGRDRRGSQRRWLRRSCQLPEPAALVTWTFPLEWQYCQR